MSLDHVRDERGRFSADSENPAASAWQHAPHDEADSDDARAVFRSDLPPDLQFTPVPRQTKRSNGFTPERQRTFIAMLAATGSVTTACSAIDCSTHAIYKLRHAAGAESFAAAWDAAVARGARRILDVMVDNAINGTPEYLYVNGQIAAERRRFNTRAQMWIVSHYLPEMFGVTGGLMHSSGSAAYLTRMKKEWRREWEAERRANQRDPDEIRASILKKLDAIERHEHRAIAADPEKRAAYEVLHGPQDWGRFVDEH